MASFPLHLFRRLNQGRSGKPGNFLRAVRIAGFAIVGFACSSNTPDSAGQAGSGGVSSVGGSAASAGQLGSGGVNHAGGNSGTGGTLAAAGSSGLGGTGGVGAGGAAGSQCGPTTASDPA